MINEERLVGEFLQLVQIDSPTGQERKVADYLKQRLCSLGFQVEEDRAGDRFGGNTGNLIARVKGHGPCVLFCAHMDTVQPGEGIVPVLKDGVITSTGETVLGGDDKAGICAILEAVQVVKEHSLPHPDLVLVFTAAEEGGLKGAKALDAAALGAKMGYCLDAGGPVGSIVNRGPAQNQIKAVISGKAAHAGLCPEDGISAIQVAAEVIMRTRLGRIDSETTANIGIIHGGKATNIVPDRVELEGEARSLVVEKLAKQTKHMVETLEKVCLDRGATVNLSCTEAYPAIDLPENSPVIALAAEALQQLSIVPQVMQTGGGSDANIFNSWGLPTANLGIGMEKVHSCEEFIRVKDMVDIARLLVQIMKLAQG